MLTDVRLGLLILVCLALGGCGTLYVAQAAKGQLQILHAREPIPHVLGRKPHSALTVTVADCEGLVERLGEA